MAKESLSLGLVGGDTLPGPIGLTSLTMCCGQAAAMVIFFGDRGHGCEPEDWHGNCIWLIAPEGSTLRRG